jgi:hypothetical protein
VVPAGFEEIPEYRTAGVVTQPATGSALKPTAPEPPVAETRPETGAAALAVPAVLQTPVPQAGQEGMGDAATEDTDTVDQATSLPAGMDDLTGSMSDSPTVVSDDSVTLAGTDPLLGFFFSGKDDAESDPSPGGGKNRPRDFEW